MCGIFGIATKRSERADAPDPAHLRATVDRLFRLSETRGKEAAGVAVHTGEEIRVYKRPIAASAMLRHRAYRNLFLPEDGGRPRAVIGHSRLVTNGSEALHHNNQPVIGHGIAGIHNGIVVNAGALWRALPDRERGSEVDSEVIFALLRHHLDAGAALGDAVARTFDAIDGQASIAALLADRDALVLHTNNGSLHVALDAERRVLVFASERHILQRLLRRDRLLGAEGFTIEKISPSNGLAVDLARFDVQPLPGPGAAAPDDAAKSGTASRPIRDVDPQTTGPTAPATRIRDVPPEIAAEFERFRDAIAHLRRCRRCVLPETMPFLEYDDEGICSYCRDYRPVETKPREELERLVDALRRPAGEPDCLFGLSGGRDSSYALHVLRTELDLEPVAFTYDWGMITDLARRNVSRLCGRLGIEHILVSADIRAKRRNIRRNVHAWLDRPDLGVIPLFMAGDKQYFHHANRLKRQLGLDATFMGENLLERTDFKTGYCGIPPRRVDDDRVYVLETLDQARLALYYGGQFLRQPGYWNVSLPDTLWGFASYYLIPRDYVNFYRYVPWQEETVERTIRDVYDWETAPDTPTTWRIGDGTAPFYNYIYYVAGGFSENDTLRSNQIREGQLDRATALARVETENRPRYDAIRWYCETIGIDWIAALRKIHRIPKRYPL